MASIDLVIFDCDGVLVDSEIVASRAQAKMLAKIGYEISPEQLSERFAGLTFSETLMAIEAETSNPVPASLIEDTEAEIDKRLAREVVAVDGAADALRSVDLPFCICSNSSCKRLEITLNRTKLRPLVTGELFSARDLPDVREKPAPDVYLHAARQMNADPAKTFVIEDSTHGVHGAVQAGMRVIGFTGASHTYPGHAEKLEEAGAETVIARLADFKPMIEAMAEFGALV